MLTERGDDPDKLIYVYRDVLNAALKAKPADMAITTHTCRGNFKSTFIASGGYEPVADMVFNQIDVDGYFMEWDDDRSGGFEPLRFLPKGDKQVVLGLVTSKFGTRREQGQPQAPHRGGREIRAARAALPVAAMRLRLDRGRQCAGRGRAMGEAFAHRRGREGGVGMSDEPCFDIAHLAHVELLTDKPEASLDFFVNVYGLTESGREGEQRLSARLGRLRVPHAQAHRRRHHRHRPCRLSRHERAGPAAPRRGDRGARRRHRLGRGRSRPWPRLSLPRSRRPRLRDLFRHQQICRPAA